MYGIDSGNGYVYGEDILTKNEELLQHTEHDQATEISMDNSAYLDSSSNNLTNKNSK